MFRTMSVFIVILGLLVPGTTFANQAEAPELATDIRLDYPGLLPGDPLYITVTVTNTTALPIVVSSLSIDIVTSSEVCDGGYFSTSADDEYGVAGRPSQGFAEPVLLDPGTSISSDELVVFFILAAGNECQAISVDAVPLASWETVQPEPEPEPVDPEPEPVDPKPKPVDPEPEPVDPEPTVPNETPQPSDPPAAPEPQNTDDGTTVTSLPSTGSGPGMMSVTIGSLMMITSVMFVIGCGIRKQI